MKIHKQVIWPHHTHSNTLHMIKNICMNMRRNKTDRKKKYHKSNYTSLYFPDHLIRAHVTHCFISTKGGEQGEFVSGWVWLTLRVFLGSIWSVRTRAVHSREPCSSLPRVRHGIQIWKLIVCEHGSRLLFRHDIIGAICILRKVCV